MSASLVGSEMCIRDRDATPLADSMAQGKTVSAKPATVMSCAKPTGNGAVSYTHLTLPTICSV
eukprot:805151-Alexandrium_andersonii.AAC.1